MKKFFLATVLFLFFCSMNLLAEAPFSEPSQNTEVQYRLFPTQNMWTFLKLDTTTGKIWQVQFSVNEDSYRFESEVNDTDLSDYYHKQYIKGRYTLFPTQNIYNFILLDQIDGDVYQVQWSTKPENRGVVPIRSELSVYLKSFLESEKDKQ